MIKLNLEKWESGLEKIIAVVLVLLAWELIPRLGIINAEFLPPFSVVIRALIKLIASGEMLIDLSASFNRALIGFALAVALAIPVGVSMGWFKRFERVVDPLLQLCRNTSVLALYPVFILFFGLSEFSKVLMIFWGSLWPLLLNTIGGVKSVDPLLIKSARSMGASQPALLLKVIIPSAMPFIVTGLRLSVSRSVLLLVAVEMLGADKGLGYLIFNAGILDDTPTMYAGIITIAFLGVLINHLLLRFDKHMNRWQEQVEHS